MHFVVILLRLFFCFRGEKFLMLPYVVKGMDVSFSGILSHLEEQVGCTFMEQGVCMFSVDSNLLYCLCLVCISVIMNIMM